MTKVRLWRQVENGATRIVGEVKWFDPVKGFGFVVAESGVRIFCCTRTCCGIMAKLGRGFRADRNLVQETERGVQAVEVFRIDPPMHQAAVPLTDFQEMDEEAIRAAPLEPARVKWFDNGKGFGFANVFGKSEDIFLHIEVLRRSGLADLQPGEALALRVIDGKRGRMATEVLAWENAVSLDD